MLYSAKLLALCIFMTCGLNLASASQPVSVKFKVKGNRKEINQS